MLIVHNIEKGFRVTSIWPWDGINMVAKMGPSQTYWINVDKAANTFMQLQIEEIQ